MQRVPMTVQGAEALQVELDHLKMVERPRIINDIAEARAHGDLKENAEYHAAKEEQGFAEGRIQEIEGKISDAQVIDITKLPKEGRVVFGVTVTIVNIETDEKHTYQLVGEDEADIKQNKISIASPIARGLIGKRKGDEAIIITPQGEKEMEVLNVEYL